MATPKIMPNSLEAEQAVISSMFANSDAIDIVSETLTEQDFYNKYNRYLFKAILLLHDACTPIDAVTLTAKLKEIKAPENIANVDFVNKIVNYIDDVTNVKDYAKIVYEKSALRTMIALSEATANNCFAQEQGLSEILETAEHEIFQIMQAEKNSTSSTVKDVLTDVMANIRKVAESGGELTGIASGFYDLDKLTNGFQSSDLVILAARPSMGKTAFALSVARYAGLKSGKSVAVFSLEMSKESLVNRLLSMESKVDSQKMRAGNLDEEDWAALREGAQNLKDAKIIIDETSGLSISQFRSRCRKYKAEHDIQLILVDYIGLMECDKKNVHNKQEELAEISKAIKGVAKELKVPIIALCQLNRDSEKRNDHRPQMSDLRESGAIEQDADVIMFLYRDDFYNEDTEEKNIAEVIIAKQRNGPIGTIKLAWLPQYTQFANLARIS